MLDDPKINLSSPQAFDEPEVDADPAFEAYRAYLLSPEFKRRICEHFQKATRRAIEEGRHLDSELRARTNS